METSSVLELGTISIGLFGGLALFLFGMEQMTDALKSVAGGGMKRTLARLTTNRFKASFAGAFITAVFQSSSVTTVLVVGFISVHLMTLSQSIGVILGANIGSTLTAQIIAFNVTQYGLVLVTVGFAMHFFFKKEKVRYWGAFIMGLGLIFFGMDLMSNATRPLRTYEPFIALMQSMDSPLYGILVAAAITGIIQSSGATTGIIIVLASQGFITLEAGIALAFGANIGTCVTALLAAIGKPREAIQAAVVHVLFNVIGVLIWVAFIDELASAVRWFSPSSPRLAGADRLMAETPRQIANAHTLFNVANTFIFIWFTTPLAKLVQWLVPARTSDEVGSVKSRYLDDILLETPTLALDRVRMEMRRLGERAYEMVDEALPVALHGDREALEALAKRDDEVDILHGAIVTYLGKLSQENLSNAQSHSLYQYINAANSIESIGDMIETNIVGAGLERQRLDVAVSESTRDVLRELSDKVRWTVQMALESFDASDPRMASMVLEAKQEVNYLAERADQHLAHRLVADEDERLALFKIESELIEYLKRVYYFAKRIAKVVVEMENGKPVDETKAEGILEEQ